MHLSKSLKLVKTITTKETQYQPYDPSKPLKLGESIVTEEVNYRTLFAGQFFPELECPDVFKDDLDAYLKPKLISRLAYREPRGLNHSYAQATCATQVGCIDIPKLDFAKMATTVMIKAALSESRLVWVPMSELKGQWVLQREWDEYKKRITQDARVKKAARKWIEAKEIAEFTAHHFAYDLKPGV